MGQDKKSRSGPRIIDPITDEPYPSKVDFQHLFSQIKAEREKMEASQKKKKMSYSVSPSSQVLIKNLAESYGATQGGIVDLAPFFFSSIMQKSLKSREEKLPLLNDISRQATGSLNGMALNAPHLKPYIDLVLSMIESITAMEKRAVADQNFQGVNADHIPEFNSVNKKSTPPAFLKEILEFMGEDNELEDLLKTLFEDGS